MFAKLQIITINWNESPNDQIKDINRKNTQKLRTDWCNWLDRFVHFNYNT